MMNTFKITRHPPYEKVLTDCMKGDLTIFARQDGIEAMWAVVDPIIERWESIPALNSLIILREAGGQRMRMN